MALLQLSSMQFLFHLWSRPGLKFQVEQGISLQRELNVISYVLYADLEVSKIIGLRFTPSWKA